MAGLEQLLQLIYHERQQEGSNLCAQHALNSLLQGNYFTAPDLSEFARKMDILEQSSRYGDATQGHVSTNMDDTGFFSVQVLEEALNIWGLSLVRWRSEAMESYQNEPHNQTAFVLNQNQHWYTLRRFGNISNPGNGHWFNLDSAKRQPQWISKLYLGMFLQQAESNGYSIFAITQIDIDARSHLPHVDADEIASTLPDPTSATGSSAARDDTERGFENEDMELQAALQASLMETGESNGSWAISGSYPPPQVNLSAADIRESSPSNLSERAGRDMEEISSNQNSYGNADVDPIAASMERDRLVMERIRREQELGFRQQYEEEVGRFGHQKPLHEPRDGDNEDEHFRHAIAVSLAERHARGDLDDDSDYTPSPDANIPYNMGQQNRVYDDDDVNFQTALRASLESAPPGFSQSPMRSLITQPSPPISTTFNDDDQIDDKSETDTSTITSESGVAEEVLSMEEMRRRRLARFGG